MPIRPSLRAASFLKLFLTGVKRALEFLEASLGDLLGVLLLVLEFVVKEEHDCEGLTNAMFFLSSNGKTGKLNKKGVGFFRAIELI